MNEARKLDHRAEALAPQHYAFFEISRSLIVLSVYDELFPEGRIKFENLMLLDFATQYPRMISPILEELEFILEVNEELAGDISDLFAKEKIENINEKFSFLISSLVARELAVLNLPGNEDSDITISITQKGREVSRNFSSRYSFYIRELSEVLVKKWHKSDHSRIMKEIFENVPEYYGERMSLSLPFVIWEDEVE